MESICTATAFLVRSPSPMGRLTQQDKPLPAQGLTNQHQAAQQIPAWEGRSLAASSQGRGDPCPQVVSPVSASCFGLSCLPCSPCCSWLLAGCMLGKAEELLPLLCAVACGLLGHTSWLLRSKCGAHRVATSAWGKERFWEPRHDSLADRDSACCCSPAELAGEIPRLQDIKHLSWSSWRGACSLVLKAFQANMRSFFLFWKN